MKLQRLSFIIFILINILCVAQVMHYYPLLPEKVASHFGPSGKPDGWSSKADFIHFYFITLGIIDGIFLLIGFAVFKIPVSLINLPNKDYWLSPERKLETFAYMFYHFFWFASATLLLLFDVMNQTFQVHLGRFANLPHPVLSLSVYIGFTVIWCVNMIVRFSKKQPN